MSSDRSILVMLSDVPMANGNSVPLFHELGVKLGER